MLYVALGAITALSGVWLGFYLARLSPEATPSTPSLPEHFEGAVLDSAVYPDEVADE